MTSPSHHRTKPLVAIVATVVALVGLGLPASAATISGPDEMTLLALHNHVRNANGRPALADDVALRDVARDWARSMADRRSLSHNPNVTTQVRQRVTVEWSRLAENIGVGADPNTVFQAWLDSAPHRANILGDYNRIGIGVARDAGGTVWVAVVLIKGPAIPVVPWSAWSPFATPYALVERQYLDFLSRGADAAGLDGWATVLRAGRQSAPAVIESFLRSLEFGAVVAPVVRLYFAAFDRVPDHPGLRSWLDAARNGVSMESIARGFASTPEFRDRYGRLSNRQYVEALYRNVLGRTADAASLDHWTGALDRGQLDRGQVLNALAQSPEFVSRSDHEVLVTMIYVGMLRRAPDPAGFVGWVGALDRGQSPQQLIAGFLGSTEYRNRVT